MSAIRLQLEAVGLGHLWTEGDLDWIAEELGRRRSFAVDGTAGARALLLASTLTEWWRGDFPTFEEISRDVLEAALQRDDVLTAAVITALFGMTAALRGEDELAAKEIDAALELVSAIDAPAVDVTVRSMRIAVLHAPEWSEVAAELDSCRALADRLGRPDIAASVDLAEGWALASVGRFDDAIDMLERAAGGDQAPLDRAIALTRLAEVRALGGQRDRAIEVASDACAIFEKWNARYWMARTAVLLSSLESDRGGRRMRAALDGACDDPAYARLFAPTGELVINLRNGPAISRDGEPLTFLTRHAEATVRLLAAAGERGMDVQEITSLLWPEADDAKVGQRFRTMLWQVRSGLGSDSWRLQRRRDRVTLDCTGIAVDGRLDRKAIAAAFGG